ncbi:hypothetical protein XELAEV_18009648mg [Xenopus laevis]|uniref:Uncharacterized protein n=1 Tax=Xenopus laevis TaxID=8355 RepID=A0A974I192_XENLA|nr:hypothetical protein XELAEV_18009648mg [Xenopus laevis]
MSDLKLNIKKSKLLGFEIPLDPKWYLLCMDPPTPLAPPARKMVNKLLFLARKLIAFHWRASLPPTYQAWEKAVQDLQKVEDLIARRNGTFGNYGFWKMYNCLFNLFSVI